MIYASIIIPYKNRMSTLMMVLDHLHDQSISFKSMMEGRIIVTSAQNEIKYLAGLEIIILCVS